jgi:hypothetical protein
MYKPFDKLTRPFVIAAALGLVLPAIATLGPASSATNVSPAAVPQQQRLFQIFRPYVASPFGNAAPATAMRSYSFGRLASPVNYNFTKIDDNNGKNYTELLGISNDGRIAGYVQPTNSENQHGFKLEPPYGQNDFKNEDVSGALRTEVTSIDQNHDLGGFWRSATGGTFGFVKWHGVVKTFSDPNTSSTYPCTEILGVNDNGIAVGYYDDNKGVQHGFEVNVQNGTFADIVPAGSTGIAVQATGINDKNEIVGGFELPGANVTSVGWLLRGKATFVFADPNGLQTIPSGINDNDEIVGFYADKQGGLQGFTLTNPSNPHFQTVDAPNSLTNKTIFSTVNGVNDKGELVGDYVGKNGNLFGFLATP